MSLSSRTVAIGALGARDGASLVASEQADEAAEAGECTVVPGLEMATSDDKGSDLQGPDGSYKEDLPAGTSSGLTRALPGAVTQNVAVGNRKNPEALQHTGPGGRSCQVSDAATRNLRGSSTDGRSHAAPAAAGTEGAATGAQIVQGLPHNQSKGSALAGAAAGGPGRAEKSCVGTGGSAPPLTMRTTRHNKTKQPGVFQFTRGMSGNKAQKVTGANSSDPPLLVFSS